MFAELAPNHRAELPAAPILSDVLRLSHLGSESNDSTNVYRIMKLDILADRVLHTKEPVLSSREACILK